MRHDVKFTVYEYIYSKVFYITNYNFKAIDKVLTLENRVRDGSECPAPTNQPLIPSIFRLHEGRLALLLLACETAVRPRNILKKAAQQAARDSRLASVYIRYVVGSTIL